MAEHFVKVVEDGTLAAEGGWITGECEDTGEVFFIAEESAMGDEKVISEAWTSVKALVIEQAVRDGIVEYVDPANREPAEPLVQPSPIEGRTHAGRRVLL